MDINIAILNSFAINIAENFDSVRLMELSAKLSDGGRITLYLGTISLNGFKYRIDHKGALTKLSLRKGLNAFERLIDSTLLKPSILPLSIIEARGFANNSIVDVKVKKYIFDKKILKTNRNEINNKKIF
jgi:hypothetical protein